MTFTSPIFTKLAVAQNALSTSPAPSRKQSVQNMAEFHSGPQVKHLSLRDIVWRPSVEINFRPQVKCSCHEVDLYETHNCWTSFSKGILYPI